MPLKRLSPRAKGLYPQLPQRRPRKRQGPKRHIQIFDHLRDLRQINISMTNSASNFDHVSTVESLPLRFSHNSPFVAFLNTPKCLNQVIFARWSSKPIQHPVLNALSTLSLEISSDSKIQPSSLNPLTEKRSSPNRNQNNWD